MLFRSSLLSSFTCTPSHILTTLFSLMYLPDRKMECQRCGFVWKRNLQVWKRLLQDKERAGMFCILLNCRVCLSFISLAHLRWSCYELSVHRDAYVPPISSWLFPLLPFRHRSQLPHKTTNELVAFYYKCWKNTAHYQKWKSSSAWSSPLYPFSVITGCTAVVSTTTSSHSLLLLYLLCFHIF